MGDRELPSGNVTVLFSDIEGSTRLIDELGESTYISALADHRRLLRAASETHGGVEVDTQGDAFLYAFADAREGVKAAVAGQKALSRSEINVRMGLHTGEFQLTAEGYAGRELHRAARIGACGHGGQIVLSAATRALIDDDVGLGRASAEGLRRSDSALPSWIAAVSASEHDFEHKSAASRLLLSG